MSSQTFRCGNNVINKKPGIINWKLMMSYSDKHGFIISNCKRHEKQ